MESAMLEIVKLAGPMLIPTAAIIGTWYTTQYRLKSIEKMLLGNGAPGVVQRTERIEVDLATVKALCAERHRE